jgi:hypothetical protein
MILFINPGRGSVEGAYSPSLSLSKLRNITKYQSKQLISKSRIEAGMSRIRNSPGHSKFMKYRQAIEGKNIVLLITRSTIHTTRAEGVLDYPENVSSEVLVPA